MLLSFILQGSCVDKHCIYWNWIFSPVMFSVIKNVQSMMFHQIWNLIGLHILVFDFRLLFLNGDIGSVYHIVWIKDFKCEQYICSKLLILRKISEKMCHLYYRYQKISSTYLPHNKDWLKEKIYIMLRKQAGH